MKALDVAVRAHDLGKGEWPMMSVADRISHVETFLARMREKRSEVVKLLMWEIGKPLKDSEKEFDRTCDYIVDTIKALKDIDRHSAKIIEEHGGQLELHDAPADFDRGRGAMIRIILPRADAAAIETESNKEIVHGL